MSFQCSCGLAIPFKDCCGKFIYGSALPTTPEELMRSRYSAYVMKNAKYIFSLEKIMN